PQPQSQPQPQPQAQPQPQYLDRPILMMTIPGLPEPAPPSFRPKQRIFRPPTSTLNVPKPAGTSSNALSTETAAAAAGRTSSRLLEHAAKKPFSPPKNN
ncbi:hypothetical protein PIB30_079880, partial [Stylosanthes scabra]|nr:hypothetical protein [Stylosanthes scabra]